MRYGQLSFPISYDDNGYFIDALRRLRVWVDGGLLGSLHDFRVSPPHSPFSSYWIGTAFALLGVYDWAPAALNVLLALAVLVAVLYECRKLHTSLAVAICIAVLAWPVMGFLVIESRPDIVCGALTAYGVVLIAGQPWLNSGWRHQVGASALIGLAVLTKPTISPVTLAVYGLAVCGATAIDLLRARRAGARASIIPANVTSAAVVLLFCAVYSRSGWAEIIQYIRYTTADTAKDAWMLKADFKTQALYYVTGIGGNATMGVWLPVTLIAGVTAFSAGVARGYRFAYDRLALVALVSLALYVLVSITEFKSIFLGVVVSWLFLIFFVRSAAFLADALERRRLNRYIPAALLVIIAAVTFVPHWKAKTETVMAYPMTVAKQKREMVERIASIVADTSVTTPTVVFAGTGDSFNSATFLLELIARHDMDANMVEMPDHAAGVPTVIKKATYVVACSGCKDLTAWLPSNVSIQPTIDAVSASPDFEQVLTMPEVSGGTAIVYRRVR